MLWLHGGAFILPAAPNAHLVLVAKLCRDLGIALINITAAIARMNLVLHGVSVTPLMNRYARRKQRLRTSAASESPGSRGR